MHSEHACIKQSALSKMLLHYLLMSLNKSPDTRHPFTDVGVTIEPDAFPISSCCLLIILVFPE